MNSPWLIVPVKPFEEGKSRLSSALPPIYRAQLSRQLLGHVLATAASLQAFARILVVTRDRRVADVAQHYGAGVLREDGRTLNGALEQGRAAAVVGGATGLLVLPSDLPHLRREDIVMLLAAGEAAPALAIAPSRDGGTNGLLLTPATLIPFSFGPDSFERHCRLARAAGVEPVVVGSESLAFDLDWPTDLAAAAATPPEDSQMGLTLGTARLPEVPAVVEQNSNRPQPSTATSAPCPSSYRCSD